jgi:hypothetical protein
VSPATHSPASSRAGATSRRPADAVVEIADILSKGRRVA